MLITPRLILRPFDPADAPRVEMLAGDPRMARQTLALPHPYPVGAAKAWIAGHKPALAAGTEITLAVTLAVTGELIGSMSLMALSTEQARGELGCWLGVDYWSQGYGTEAARATVDHGRQTFGLSRITARCLAENTASSRMLAKLGFQLEGRQVKHVRKGERFRDILLFALNDPARP